MTKKSTLDPKIAEASLPEILRLQADRHGDKPFIKFGSSEDHTFAGMEVASNRVAHALADLGVARGDRIALMLPNCAEFVVAWFASAKLAAIEVPINPELNGKLLQHVLENASPRVIFCDAKRLGVLAEMIGHFHCDAIVVCGEGADLTVGAEAPSSSVYTFADLASHSNIEPTGVEVRLSEPMAILYTSGTTGPAKGVLMPHRQFTFFVEGLVRNLGLSSKDTYYTPLPMFHADAQLFGAYFPLLYGARGVIDPRFSASRFWDRIREEEATATNLLGAMAHILWKAEPSEDDANHPLCCCQAIPMVDFREEFETRFGIRLATGYGQTETGFVTLDSADDWRPGSCGRPALGYEVRIVDENDFPLPAGETGEIVVRHEEPWAMCMGYYGMPEKTVEAWRNLWWHSGDAGHLDEDGWLFFDGRIKDSIRRRGENISAHEVESVVNDHDAVLESAAVAVPSEMSEDEILLVVAVRTGYTLGPEELLDYCVSNMPRHMVPRYVELRDQPLPRTPSEKIAKQELGDAGVGSKTWDREENGYLIRRA